MLIEKTGRKTILNQKSIELSRIRFSIWANNSGSSRHAVIGHRYRPTFDNPRVEANGLMVFESSQP